MKLFLIVRIEDARGRVLATFARGGQTSGDPRLIEVQAVLGSRYEVKVGAAGSPLVAVAYKSPNRDGTGRMGGQFLRFGARQPSAE